jgi:hypothetical protein
MSLAYQAPGAGGDVVLIVQKAGRIFLGFQSGIVQHNRQSS